MKRWYRVEKKSSTTKPRKCIWILSRLVNDDWADESSNIPFSVWTNSWRKNLVVYQLIYCFTTVWSGVSIRLTTHTCYDFDFILTKARLNRSSEILALIQSSVRMIELPWKTFLEMEIETHKEFSFTMCYSTLLSSTSINVLFRKWWEHVFSI